MFAFSLSNGVEQRTKTKPNEVIIIQLALKSTKKPFHCIKSNRNRLNLGLFVNEEVQRSSIYSTHSFNKIEHETLFFSIFRNCQISYPFSNFNIFVMFFKKNCHFFFFHSTIPPNKQLIKGITWNNNNNRATRTDTQKIVD